MQSKSSGDIMALFKTKIFAKPYFTGVETMVSTETYIPMSVNVPVPQCGFPWNNAVTDIAWKHQFRRQDHRTRIVAIAPKMPKIRLCQQGLRL